MIIERMPVPGTDKRYTVSTSGEVYDKGVLCGSQWMNGQLVVYIKWFEDADFYDTATIMAVAYYGINIPHRLYPCIEIIYIDGNYSNLCIQNLSYRLSDDAVLHVDGETFKYIPFYTNYAISRDGRLIQQRRLRVKKWYTTKSISVKNITGGYRMARALADIGNPTHISRHRGLALAYIPYNVSPETLVVNHINGIPGDDTLTNIEWTTTAKNNLHAYATGLRPNSTTAVLVRLPDTDDHMRFNTISACAKYLGKSNSFITTRISKGEDARYSDGLVFKYDDGKPWPIMAERLRTASNPIEVIARNIFTGVKTIYESAAVASEATDVNEATILLHVHTSAVVPVGGYNFRRFDGGVCQWPNHSDRHLLVYAKNPKKPARGVVITDEDGTEAFYTDASVAAKHHGVSRSTIDLNTRPGRLFRNRYKISFYEIHENLGPPIE